MSDPTIYKAQRMDLKRRTPTPAVLLIGAGAVLLALNLFNVSLSALIWPLIVFALPGVLLMWPARNATGEPISPWAYLAVPGAFLVTWGVLAFAMFLTGHWEAMAYMWPLLPAGAVAGLMYAKRYDSKSSVHRRGEAFLRAMVALALGFALVFELLIFRSFGPWWPLALIGFGIVLFVRHQRSVH